MYFSKDEVKRLEDHDRRWANIMRFILAAAGTFILLSLFASCAHAGRISEGEWAICKGSHDECQYEAQQARREAYELCDEIEDSTEKILCRREARRQRREDWGFCRCDLLCCRRGWR